MAWNPLLIVLWSAWCLQAVLVVFQAGKFSRRVVRPPHESFDTHRPPATVIVPFKGRDPDLPGHVRALLTQDYPDYRLVLVFESDDDPARAVVQAELDRHADPPRVDFVTAGPAPADTGQKVHNQLAALALLEETAPDPPAPDDPTVWVFADSDAVPTAGWLHKMVGPHFERDRVGVTTGYRWLVPARPGRPASLFAGVINSAVAMFIGHHDLTQAWGGSMSVRAGFAREHGLADYLRGALSDDYQTTRMCRAAGKRVYFVHQCLVPSPIDLGWAGLLEFGRRQYLITRVHDPKLYLKALFVIGLYVAGAATAGAALLAALATGPTTLTAAAAAALLTVAAANQARAAYRRRAVATAFDPAWRSRLRGTLLLDRWGTTAVMLVNLVLLLSAAFGRTMTWRGNRYRLGGPQSIQKLG